MATAFIQNIIDSDELNIKLSNVHLSGYCLGGHIAGNVAEKLKSIYKGMMISSVWAFDPPRFAFPYPEEENKPKRVQKGNAKFVAVFHTSDIGVQDNIADVDIILNDGRNQPGKLAFFCILKKPQSADHSIFYTFQVVIKK